MAYLQPVYLGYGGASQGAGQRAKIKTRPERRYLRPTPNFLKQEMEKQEMSTRGERGNAYLIFVHKEMQ